MDRQRKSVDSKQQAQNRHITDGQNVLEDAAIRSQIDAAQPQNPLCDSQSQIAMVFGPHGKGLTSKDAQRQTNNRASLAGASSTLRGGENDANLTLDEAGNSPLGPQSLVESMNGLNLSFLAVPEAQDAQQVSIDDVLNQTMAAQQNAKVQVSQFLVTFGVASSQAIDISQLTTIEEFNQTCEFTCINEVKSVGYSPGFAALFFLKMVM